MLPKRICGIIKGWSMLSTFSERYYGQTPCSSTIVRDPSHRTPAALRDGAPCQGPAPCPDDFTRPSMTFCGRDCGHCLPQPRYRRACAQPLSPWWRGGHSTPQSPRAGAHGDARVESRTPAGHRPRPAHGRCPQCQLDDWLTGPLSGCPDPRYGHCRDRALSAASRRLCLQASDLDAQTQSRSAAGLRGKRLRV